MSRPLRLGAMSLACLAVFASGAAKAGFLEDLACPLFGCADGPAPRVELNCRVLGLTSDPTYRTFAWPTASYGFRGVCSSPDQTKLVVFEVAGVFSPDEHDPSKPNTSEIISITSNDKLSPDTRPQEGGAGYQEHVIFGAYCDRDPWLNSTSCTRIGDDIPDALHDMWGQLPTRRFPISRGVISDVDRYRFRRQSDEVFGVAGTGWREEAKSGRSPAPGDFSETRATELSDSAASRKLALRDADSIRVEIHYPVAYGYKNAHGLFDPGPNSCDVFQVSAVTAGANRDARQPEPIRVAVQPRMRSSNDEYICDYLISDLPENQPITVQARVGGARETSTEAWLGGSQPQPAPGESRIIDDGSRSVTLTASTASARLAFNMQYRGRFDVRSSATEKVSDSRHSALINAIRESAAAEPPICASARSARARNSPAAPGLERQ
jgi:hypothetical protein